MHRKKSLFKILFLLALLGVSAFYMGSCGGIGGGGSGGGAEESGSFLAITSIAPVDSSDVDAVRDCCYTDPSVDPCEGFTEEDFTRHDATVTISNSDIPVGTDTSTNVTIAKYTITYIPQTTGAPTLTSRTYYNSFVIPADGSVTQQVEMVPIDVKNEFVAGGGFLLPAPASYAVKYKFEGKDIYGNEVYCSGSVSIRIGSFDTCSSGTIGSCPTITTLIICPSSATMSETDDSITFTIIGGTPDYTINVSQDLFVEAFPITQSGTTFTLHTDSDDTKIATDTNVTITVTDSLGNPATATLTVEDVTP